MAAEGLDLGAAFGVEDLLPGHVHLAEVAHVQNSGLEQLADARRNAAVDRTAVGNRRLAALGRCGDRKSTRLNSSHSQISYAVFCLKKKKNRYIPPGRAPVRSAVPATPHRPCSQPHTACYPGNRRQRHDTYTGRPAYCPTSPSYCSV